MRTLLNYLERLGWDAAYYKKRFALWFEDHILEHITGENVVLLILVVIAGAFMYWVVSSVADNLYRNDHRPVNEQCQMVPGNYKSQQERGRLYENVWLCTTPVPGLTPTVPPAAQGILSLPLFKRLRRRKPVHRPQWDRSAENKRAIILSGYANWRDEFRAVDRSLNERWGLPLAEDPISEGQEVLIRYVERTEGYLVSALDDLDAKYYVPKQFVQLKEV